MSLILLFLYPVFFYKNILLSSMIVFLIANKISSFGIRGEEEAHGRWGTSAGWKVREKDEQARLFPSEERRSTSHLLCKCDNVSFLQWHRGRWAVRSSWRSRSLSSWVLGRSSPTAVASHQANMCDIKLRWGVASVCDNSQVHWLLPHWWMRGWSWVHWDVEENVNWLWR